MFTWSARSLKALEGIHPDLRKVADRALELTTVDFVVVEGCRTREQQLLYYTAGRSKTMHSRHLHGMALDFVDIKGTYKLELMAAIAAAFKLAAAELNVPIQWGGDWHTFKDTPHIELFYKRYPDPVEA